MLATRELPDDALLELNDLGREVGDIFATAANELITSAGAGIDEIAARIASPQPPISAVPISGRAAKAFSWLAKQTLHGQAGILPSVTSARDAVVLGEICQLNQAVSRDALIYGVVFIADRAAHNCAMYGRYISVSA